MSTPHDYYYKDGYDPHLVSRGNNAHFVEPDYLGWECDDQLPLVSTLGAGPRGAGLYSVIESDPLSGKTVVHFYDDVTNEEVSNTGNIHPGHIYIEGPDREAIYEGQTADMIVHTVLGGVDSAVAIPVPPGAHGSRMYTVVDSLQARQDRTYHIGISELMFCEHYAWSDFPKPRPCDTVVFKFTEKDNVKLGFGTIVEVIDQTVIFLCHTEIAVPIPTISEDYTWVINGVDTKISTRGPKGDKGSTGDTGPKGDPGDRGLPGEPGPRGYNGTDGKNANVEIGTVTTLAPTEDAYVTSQTDKETNTITLSFGIPEGAAGRAINVRGGIWEYNYLPAYDDTPVNDAFIVYDGDGRYDLYIRGAQPIQAELGGPWTVVEDWEGKPAVIKNVSVHVLTDDTEPRCDVSYTSTPKANEYDFDFYLPLADADLSGVLEDIETLRVQIAALSKAITDNYSELDGKITAGIQAAKDYADTQDETNLTAAKAYADTQVTTVIETAKVYTDSEITKTTEYINEQITDVTDLIPSDNYIKGLAAQVMPTDAHIEDIVTPLIPTESDIETIVRKVLEDYQPSTPINIDRVTSVYLTDDKNLKYMYNDGEDGKLNRVTNIYLTEDKDLKYTYKDNEENQ